ncbi:hypothetical protein [Phycicoccus sonneratiae]|uniref:Lysyl-tRNA synthetase n=1 Tax=Phycicoccus sonneratiae TaxID=2807628 RepID=A0ABS2CN52_9MICO|nr:hypothetical protein [Phycicoccus sonneraticus]MBM6401312.1 hypothetical protein [Phycicoccus sonneraticus]
MDSVVPYVVAIVPTIVVAVFFYVIIKRMIEGDRRERLAQSRFEAEEDRRRSAHESAGPGPSTAEPTPGPRDPDGPDEGEDNSPR